VQWRGRHCYIEWAGGVWLGGWVVSPPGRSSARRGRYGPRSALETCGRYGPRSTTPDAFVRAIGRAVSMKPPDSCDGRAIAPRPPQSADIPMPTICRGSAFGCFRGLRAAKAFRVPRRRAFVTRGLPRTEGWNGAAAFDEGRANRKAKLVPQHLHFDLQVKTTTRHSSGGTPLGKPPCLVVARKRNAPTATH